LVAPFWNHLPFIGQTQNNQYGLSSNAQFMVEMENVYLGPPGGGRAEVDLEDTFFSNAGKTVWTIKRSCVCPVLGFHFLGQSGGFLFAMQSPFWMGAKKKGFKPSRPESIGCNLRPERSIIWPCQTS
jgi:hypothetical protein